VRVSDLITGVSDKLTPRPMTALTRTNVFKLFQIRSPRLFDRLPMNAFRSSNDTAP
jgi:hypothetical protein